MHDQPFSILQPVVRCKNRILIPFPLQYTGIVRATFLRGRQVLLDNSASCEVCCRQYRLIPRIVHREIRYLVVSLPFHAPYLENQITVQAICHGYAIKPKLRRHYTLLRNSKHPNDIASIRRKVEKIVLVTVPSALHTEWRVHVSHVKPLCRAVWRHDTQAHLYAVIIIRSILLIPFENRSAKSKTATTVGTFLIRCQYQYR